MKRSENSTTTEGCILVGPSADGGDDEDEGEVLVGKANWWAEAGGWREGSGS